MSVVAAHLGLSLNQLKFVGGSMGDDAVIIEGVDSPASRVALFSTVHGAGRIMSRTAAKGRFENVGGKRMRAPLPKITSSGSSSKANAISTATAR